MLRRVLVVMTAVSMAMLFLLLTATTPSTAGPLGILGFFICMYVAALGVLTFLFRSLSLLLDKILPMRRRKIIPGGVSLKKAYYYASVLALVPIMLLAMQSVGEIGMYQLLLVGFFTFIAWLYVTNRTG